MECFVFKCHHFNFISHNYFTEATIETATKKTTTTKATATTRHRKKKKISPTGFHGSHERVNCETREKQVMKTALFAVKSARRLTTVSQNTLQHFSHGCCDCLALLA